MELYSIYCGFWEGMKEISVGVCLNEYTWLEIWGKKNGLLKKAKWKKMILNKSKRKKNDEKEKKNRSAIWALLCKVSGIDDIWKVKNCAPLVFRNTLCL